MEIATEVYIDHVQGSSCCGSPVQLFNGAESDISRRQKLLTFLKGNKKDIQLLKTSDPDLHRYFQEIWDVRNRHMRETVPCHYIFHLTLCEEPECIHPRCKNGETSCEMKWYEGGPSVIWLPIPVPDLKRPGSFMEPEELLCIDNSEHRMMSPPSVKLKAAAKTNSD